MTIGHKLYPDAWQIINLSHESAATHTEEMYKLTNTKNAGWLGTYKLVRTDEVPNDSELDAKYNYLRFGTEDAIDLETAQQLLLQGNMIGRADHNGPAGGGVNAEVSFTLNATDKHTVAAVDCRNLYETAETSGTLASKETGGYSLNYLNSIRTGYVIRRLTPTECERLMAFPDGYTAYGRDGKEMSDAVRYSIPEHHPAIVDESVFGAVRALG